ncbi:MAG: SIR2 family protein [Solirubrobacterales bacterium]|nr:SIR2 family protein [Solirubrobacterales bacterium]
MQVFINYRREDTEAYARLLRDRLAPAYGPENVFLDVVNLTPGLQWLEQIKDRSASSGVCLVLIGPRWLASMTERAQARFDRPADDIVKREIEFALSRGSSVQVIPVLVGGAQMPGGDGLPRSIRTLTSLHAVEVRHTHFDEDVERLMQTLAEIGHRYEVAANEAVDPEPVGAADVDGVAMGAARPAPARRPRSGMFSEATAPAPDERHFETVVSYLTDQEGVVPVLGLDVNADPPAQAPQFGAELLPTAEGLAADLAERFGLEFDPLDLAKVAQHVYLTCGSPDLHRSLKRLLPIEAEPSAVHRFLAAFPGRLDELGMERRYQMIVTTNYDVALERAFDQANEPYDLVVYMASGTDRGRFVHFPFDGDPEPINVPNHYGKLPIDEDGEVQRSLIVKIHGAVDGSSGGYRWKDNYVITEDQYIEYLSHSPVESLVPVQILDRLTGAHCLFLGYSMNDWNLRVFLKRIWQNAPIPAKSWAIEREPGTLENDFWRHSGGDLLAAPLADYVGELARHIKPEPVAPA